MPQAENTGAIRVYVDRDKMGRIDAFAKRRGHKSLADYVRHLIQQDMTEGDEPIDLDVKWGRYSEDPPGQKPKKSRKKPDAQS